MRFSLQSLVLVTFWFATAGLVWHRWFPWQHTVFPNGAPTLSAEQFSRQYPTWQDGKPYEELKSPDGTRRKENGHGSPHSLLLDQRTDEVLCVLPVAEGFLDDNHIVCLDFTITSDGDFVWGDRYLIKRRHPEWWWGHFYRPEVWLLFALTLLAGWQAAKSMRMRCGAAATESVKPMDALGGPFAG